MFESGPDSSPQGRHGSDPLKPVSITIATLTIVVITAAAAVLALDSDVLRDGPVLTGMHVTGLSGWMETDAAACPIHAPELVVWHVLDNYALYYETDRNGRFTGVYDGDDVTSETLTLDAKSYTVTIGKETFGVTVYGVIDYELSQDYNIDRTVVRETMSYTIDLYRFMSVFDGSRVRNAVIGTQGNLDFYNIPDIVAPMA